ncbi:MAG: hypothetical protein H3C39_01720 [Flavobacteriia bacterium]|nr:hypothetical protein [Flavobacteriia bacterium]
MRNLFLILFLTAITFGYSQELPTEPANGYAFPIGSKFTIKLYETDSACFDYSIIEFEPFQEIVDIFDTNDLFKEDGEEGTIEYYFCIGTRGDTEEERQENMQVLLLMKNRTKFILSYKSEIQRTEEGEFEETSNIGIYPGAKGSEMWPYMIYSIGLRDFEISK